MICNMTLKTKILKKSADFQENYIDFLGFSSIQKLVAGSQKNTGTIKKTLLVFLSCRKHFSVF